MYFLIVWNRRMNAYWERMWSSNRHSKDKEYYFIRCSFFIKMWKSRGIALGYDIFPSAAPLRGATCRLQKYALADGNHILFFTFKGRIIFITLFFHVILSCHSITKLYHVILTYYLSRHSDWLSITSFWMIIYHVILTDYKSRHHDRLL